jgi:hypothetical protein
MNDPELPEQDNRVEVVDLESTESADYPEASWARRRALAWQRRLTRKRVRLLSASTLIALLVIAVLASVMQTWPLTIAALFSSLSHSPSSAAARPVSSINVAKVLLPQQDGIVCLVDAAWSPDSRLIAVAGYEGTCLDNGFPNGPGSLLIYDARSGKLVWQMATDSSVLATFHRLFPRDHRAPVLDYQKVLWSPDGTRLALPFGIVFSKTTLSGIQMIPAYSGILLLDADGTHPQVFLQSQNSVSGFAEWDTLQGRQVRASAGQSLFLASPLATAFRWGNAGALLPLNQPQRSLAPIGNPAGGQSFSIWQPGNAEIEPPYSGPASQQSAMYFFNTFFSAWSPDGRYVAIISIAAPITIVRYQRARRSTMMFSAPNPPPRLTSRVGDLAFQRALETITGPLVPSNLVMLSWRFDGRALAVYNAGTTELDILDCATGDQTASLLLSTTVPPGQLNGPYLLHWSPDGSHLLMFDPGVGDLLTWDMHPSP